MLNDDIINCLTFLIDNEFSKDKLVSYFLQRMDDDLMYDFISQIQSIQNDSLKEIIYICFLKIGRNYFRNLFKNLSCLEECISYFRTFGPAGRRVDVSLMNEILKVQECSISEIQMYDDSFIITILDEIELERDDEEYNYGLLKLLV